MNPLSQRTTKPTIRLVETAKTQISLCTLMVWSESLLIACAFYSLQDIQRGINETLTYWMYVPNHIYPKYSVRQACTNGIGPVLIPQNINAASDQQSTLFDW